MFNSSQNILDNKSNLNGLQIRPCLKDEEAWWNKTMSTYHYLGFKQLVGESLKYVAVLNNCPVALLGWGCAAFKSRHRDKWIGWTPKLQWQRLKYVVNNMRFLILPNIKVKNLASSILALNTRRLSTDYQDIYGHPVFIAESFVDHSRFKGTCYLAAGWIPLGQTRGYLRNGGKYYFHGICKTIFIKPLQKNAQSILSAPYLPPQIINSNYKDFIMNIESFNVSGKKGLLEKLSLIIDNRKPRGIRHEQVTIIAIAICASLTGCRSFAAIAQWALNLGQELRKKFGCKIDARTGEYIVPSEPTIRRVLQQINPNELDIIISEWLSDDKSTVPIAVDGKTLKGSGKHNKKPVHLMAALLHKEGAVIAQQQVDVKTNEIKVFQPLLNNIDVEGKVITADALHTQVDHAKYIKERKADYLFTVKGNQSSLLDDIKSLDIEAFPPSVRRI
jgi:hypothetical protein